MATRGDSLPTRWDRPPHTKAKHDIFVKYLQAWFAIFGASRYYQRVILLDGFAGPGRYANGEPGSPVLALEALIDHDHFARWSDTEYVVILNELDKERYESLVEVTEELKAERRQWPSNVRIVPTNQPFSELAEEMLSAVGPGADMAPLFAFVDPFGYKDVPLDLVRRLVEHRSAELFIYFDFNSMVRFANAGNVDHLLTPLFGSDEYKNAPTGPGRGDFLHDLYERQLRAECSFAHVRSFAMVNETGHIGNYLFFCTRNLQAFDRMKAAMWSLDPSGDFRFEDRMADQLVLFGDKADTETLQDDLASHFAGRRVSIEDVTQYVIADTAYHSGQIKRETLAVMQRAGRISSPNQKTRNTFPAGTLIDFP